MKSNLIYNQVRASLNIIARPVDLALIDFLSDRNYETVLFELLKFQNEDGGFGNALEPDIRMPFSSAVATEVAVKILKDLTQREPRALKACKSIIDEITKYLWSTYNSDTSGWEIVPKEVDDFPHAVWWNYEGIQGFAPFNPTATLAGFLYKYDPDDLRTNKLVSHMIELFMNTPNEGIEGHGLSCLIHLQEYLNEDESIEKTTVLLEKIQIDGIPLTLDRFNNKINAAIIAKADWNPDNWNTYTMEPLKYIDSNEHPLYLEYSEIIQQNLDFLINNLNANGYWDIHFTWCQYEEVFEKTAKTEWLGYFAYENLKRLLSFRTINIG